MFFLFSCIYTHTHTAKKKISAEIKSGHPSAEKLSLIFFQVSISAERELDMHDALSHSSLIKSDTGNFGGPLGHAKQNEKECKRNHREWHKCKPTKCHQRHCESKRKPTAGLVQKHHTEVEFTRFFTIYDILSPTTANTGNAVGFPKQSAKWQFLWVLQNKWQ